VLKHAKVVVDRDYGLAPAGLLVQEGLTGPAQRLLSVL
jgi:hypothetical protein